MTRTSQAASVDEAYVRLTPGSEALYQKACQLMPGGTTRTSTFLSPYPLYLERGEGCWVWDVDGTARLDLGCNYTCMILGHAHPAVVRAVQAQLSRGTSFAAGNPFEVAFAEAIRDRVPSMERLRFTNSGTEATMFALRLARAHTGRQVIAKVEGGYQGSHDFVQVSTRPDVLAAGPREEPLAIADSAGVPACVLDHVVVLPFNDTAAAVRILTRHADDLAAVVVEPVLGSGGCLPADPEYLEAIRQVTRRLGIVLIFDEVISFRVGRGGAQELYRVTPDLTTLGKVIGGGLAVGAFGGRADIMEVLDPRGPRSIPHAGSLNGHPLGMVAGLATLEQLSPETFAELGRKGQWVREALEQTFRCHGVAAQVTGIASLFGVHFTAEPIRDHRDVRDGDQDRLRRFIVALANHGVLLSNRGMGALSTPVSDDDLRYFVECVDRVLAEGSLDR